MNQLGEYLYLAAAICFILTLRGLSSPATARRGNLYGMVGMGIAILTTLAVAAPTNPLVWIVILAGIAIGGGIGAAAGVVNLEDSEEDEYETCCTTGALTVFTAFAECVGGVASCCSAGA